MKKTTSEWVSKAEADFDAVVILRRSRKPNRFDVICFHCQQCAEKYFKARLNEEGIFFSKTHDLVLLVQMLQSVEPLWLALEPRLKQLTEFAVAVRYPGRSVDQTSASEAFVTCNRVRKFVRESLGLKV
jgi:HEPN domain-containing protein